MLKTRLPFFALTFGLLVAACATNPDVSGDLDAQAERLGQLEQELEDVLAALSEMRASESVEAEHEEHEETEAAQASAFELAVAQYIMDTAGFHRIDEALTETGEIDPSFVSTVTRVARIVGSTQWPDDLSESAAHLLEVLTEFQSSLAEDDAEGATPLAGMAHDHQHDLSAAITAWLSGEMSMEGEHEHSEEEGHAAEMHEPAHGGQVGMSMGTAIGGADFHLELVSAAPGQYIVYLSDADRTPVSPEGYSGTLALIRPDGSEIASIPFMAMADHLMAEGGPTDLDQADVRVALEGPDLEGTLEMEFSIVY